MANGPHQILSGVRLLLVDADTTALFLNTELLEYFGATVKACQTIAAALALVEKNFVDVIISELDLPDGTGQTLLGYLRAYEDEQELTPAVLLALTAEPSTAVLKQAVADGFADYVIKGTNPIILKTTIARLVGR